MFEKAFKNIDNKLRNDDGTSTPIDYIEQTTWILFLRYLHQMESNKAEEAKLTNKTYQFILDEKYRWNTWAVPKKSNGEYDLNKAKTGADLIHFINDELFPYLGRFKETASNPKTLEYKIGTIYSTLRNTLENGYGLRDIIESIDTLKFKNNEARYELSVLYEERLNKMGNAGRSGGELYTPRAVIKAIIKVIDPKVGETVFDPAVGSAGFLCACYDYMTESRENLSTNELQLIQKDTFFGKEKKKLPFVLGVMNMILHGIEAPNIVRTNTLEENLRDIQEKDRYDVILANPPFGGDEDDSVQNNFDIKSGETAYLFLQYFIKSLKAGGRAGIVIKNTLLSNEDANSLRQYILKNCNVHTILHLPKKTFQGSSVNTIVIFFTKGEMTKKIWNYELDPGRSLGKNNPLNDKDMSDFIKLQKNQEISEKSWILNIADIDEKNFEISCKNPNKSEDIFLRIPQEIISKMESIDTENKELLIRINKLFQNQLNEILSQKGDGWVEQKLGDLCSLIKRGISPVYVENEGIEVINQKCIRHHKIDMTLARRHNINKKSVNAEKYIQLGDVLVNSTGVGTLGRVAQVRHIVEGNVTVDSHVTIVRPKPDLFFIDFFGYALIKIEGEIAKSGTGSSGQTELARTKLQDNFLVSYPSSFEEQKRIVKLLDSIEEITSSLKFNFQEELGSLDELKESILDKIFKGEL